jgi:DNA-binding winged helix-turn-helix (wHTH) protein
MHTNTQFFLKRFIVLLLFVGLVSCSQPPKTNFEEVVKVALRDVGHRLLLADRDSTSLVQPVIALDHLQYQVSFEVPLSMYPDSLVDIVKRSFEKAGLPPYYLTEVIRCEDGEVGYSYEVKQEEEKGIIHCGGRNLPEACYTIHVQFTKVPEERVPNAAYYFYGMGIAGLLLFTFFYYKRKGRSTMDVEDANYSALGRFKFYPDQNKLIREATEINLSKKECELLALFVAQPNQIIKRDELTKKVWEENGVFVGRSLDTYISKLRKKLQGDDSINIVNVHGVGYKLEVG